MVLENNVFAETTDSKEETVIVEANYVKNKDPMVAGTTDADNTVVIGNGSKVEGKGEIGGNNVDGQEYIKGTDSIAIGYKTSVYDGYGTAIGTRAQIQDGAMGAVAVGERAKVLEGAEAAVSIGRQAISGGLHSIAIGDGAKSMGVDGIALGNQAFINSENEKNSIAIGNTATIRDDNNIGSEGNNAIGSSVNIKNSKYSTALGFGIKIKGAEYSTASGAHADISSKCSTAYGAYANVSGDYGAALGYNSNASGYISTALGSYANVSGNYSVAIGYKSNVTAEQSAAVGDFSSVTADYGVALGSYSLADTQSGEIGYGYDGNANGQISSVWKSTLGAISVGNVNSNQTRQITGVAAGTKDTDAVNVAQLKQVANKVDKLEETINNIDKNGGDLGFVGDVDKTETNKGEALPQEKPDTSGDKQMTIIGGVNDADKLTENNIGVVTKDDKLVVQLGKELSDIDSIQVNEEVKVGDVSISKDGINAGDNKITGVADGEISETSKDAVNGSQLYATNQKIDNITQDIDNIRGDVNKLEGRIDKVGAGAAALAALHPLDFDPDEKLVFSAGVGHYHGETAAALGAFYRPDEKVMFSLGSTVGNGQEMVNMGVSFALDRNCNVNNSKVAMAKDIIDLREQVASLTAIVNHLTSNNVEEKAYMMFSDVPANHWAYGYLEELIKANVIEGYPDGNFYGDRTMTRYEFATMLYRAMQKGVTLDSKIVKEFEAEIGRVRVDRINGEDNSADKVERVRVIIGKDRDLYGSQVNIASKE